MKKIQFLTKLMLIISIAFIYSCSKSKTDEAQQTEVKDSFIKITKAQFKTEGMEIGNPVLYNFEEIIKTNGYIISPPNGKAQIGTPISGKVKNVSQTIGKYVTKGTIIATIESNEIITIQENFIEAVNNLKVLSANYDRMKALSNENIASQKSFMTVESDYLSAKAKYQGLKSRLVMLNLNPQHVENGNISSSVYIYSPINGFITSQNCVIGQYVEPQNILFEIIDLNQLYLQFFVFEKDISKIEKGQQIRFYSPDNTNKIVNATVSLIGKTINSQTKSIECNADIKKDDSFTLLNGMYVQVDIVFSLTKIKVLPTEAIIKSGNYYYVLSKVKQDKANYYCEKIQVKIGKTNNNYTEILENDNLKDVIIKGVYNLNID